MGGLLLAMWCLPPSARPAPAVAGAPVCSCLVRPPTPAAYREDLASGLLAFEAQLLSVKIPPDSVMFRRESPPRLRAHDVVARVVVRRRWRVGSSVGPAAAEPPALGDTLEIVTGRGGGDCGLDFVAGDTWVFTLVRAPDGVLRASLCDGSQPAAEATALRRLLDAAVAPPVRRGLARTLPSRQRRRARASSPKRRRDA